MKIELVTTLKRQATKILAELLESKEPVLLTEHGKPSAYLLGFEDYQYLETRMEILEGIARGEKAVFEGQVLNESQAKQKMRQWRG